MLLLAIFSGIGDLVREIKRSRQNQNIPYYQAFCSKMLLMTPKHKRYLIFLLLMVCVCGTSRADFKDYSNVSKEHQILKNIRFEALNVTFVEKRKVVLLGETFEASVFTVKTREDANAVDGPAQYPNVHADLDIVYELIIGPDNEYKIHDPLIEELYSISLKASDNAKEFKDIGLVQGLNTYLIYIGSVKMPNLIWFDGRFMQVKFKYFDSKIRRRDRAETTETFWQNKIRFYSGEQKILLKPVKDGFREEFLRLYKEKKFKKS